MGSRFFPFWDFCRAYTHTWCLWWLRPFHNWEELHLGFLVHLERQWVGQGRASHDEVEGRQMEILKEGEGKGGKSTNRLPGIIHQKRKVLIRMVICLL